ncbi:MAG: hypothetical protein LBN95_00540 [Prevotellaceae bacterium]|jgi:hypothetical protein|nr:hypothetical protein [Prevotellaceae bacterium]
MPACERLIFLLSDANLRLVPDLKSQIFITVGERSVACGVEKRHCLFSTGRTTDSEKSFAFQAIERGALRSRQSPVVMNVKPFGLSGKKTKNV